MMFKVSGSTFWSPEVHNWNPPEDTDATAKELIRMRGALQQALMLLTEAEAKQDAFAWKPIETAPRDRLILLFRPNAFGQQQVLPGYLDTCEDRKHPRPFWRSAVGRANVTRDRDFPPTHWMDLPEPPTLEVGNG